MKERFSGLMRQELNSLDWIPSALSGESQILLIKEGSVVPAVLLPSFGDASEQQVLEKWNNWARKVTLFCLDHFVTLFISAYKYAVFSGSLWDWSRQMISLFHLQKTALRYPKGLGSFGGSLLVGGFTGIISRGIACFWRRSFSPWRRRGKDQTASRRRLMSHGGRKHTRRRTRDKPAVDAPLSLTPITPGGLH